MEPAAALSSSTITVEVLPMSTASRSVPGTGEGDAVAAASGVDPVRARQIAGSSQTACGSRPSRIRSTAQRGQPAGQSGVELGEPRGIAHVAAVS